MIQPRICQQCGQEAEGGACATPLCAPCRDRLARRPLLWWLTTAGAIILALVLVALAQFPASMQAGIAFERGHRAEAAGRYTAAASEYRKVVDCFPDSSTAIQRYGICQYRVGNFPEAIRTLDRLSGQSGDEETVREVNQAEDDMARRMAEETRHY